ncbi:hypothetical protein F5Y19DRAFT_446350 [Xylariaceae sp. FL1651]|nr:hypothetical protein F5Y19DRAFT_446350 [Xylariaceae sp. FL1651]
MSNSSNFLFQSCIPLTVFAIGCKAAKHVLTTSFCSKTTDVSRSDTAVSSARPCNSSFCSLHPASTASCKVCNWTFNAPRPDG